MESALVAPVWTPQGLLAFFVDSTASDRQTCRCKPALMNCMSSAITAKNEYHPSFYWSRVLRDCSSMERKHRFGETTKARQIIFIQKLYVRVTDITSQSRSMSELATTRKYPENWPNTTWKRDMWIATFSPHIQLLVYSFERTYDFCTTFFYLRMHLIEIQLWYSRGQGLLGQGHARRFEVKAEAEVKARSNSTLKLPSHMICRLYCKKSVLLVNQLYIITITISNTMI